MTEKTRPGIKEAAAAFFLRVKEWYISNFAQTECAVFALSLAISSVLLTVQFADMYWPTVVGYSVSFSVIFLVLLFVSWIIPKILKKLFGYGFRSVLSAAMLGYSLYDFIRRGAGEGHTFRVIAFAAAVFLAVWIFAVALWKIVRHRRLSPTTAVTVLLSAAVLVGFGWLVVSEGFDSGMIGRYVALTANSASGGGELSTEAGQYEAAALDYGTEEGIASEEVTLMPYMTRDDAGLNGVFAENYLGYTLRSVPLVGRIWYPKGGENCPVLFIAHGNHKITEPSYEGYEYLGTYLASHGYVVVSVDQNACNMMSGENDARAVLLLKHVGQILKYNTDEDNPLYGVIDGDNIALAGHSRGGEIVATAYLFNGYDRYPENGTIRFDFDYSVKSLIAIAPTSNQYEPADHSVEIEDVNYLLLHGMQDADVKKIMGMTQYENVSFTGDGDYIKSALYIGGANHGQFNTLWGEYDRTLPQGALLNTADLIEEGEQQKIAMLFIKTFLDVTLKGDKTHRALLTNWDAYADSLPDTVYSQCFQSSDYVPVAEFEEDSDLETGTADNVGITTSGVTVWTEEYDGISGGEDNHTLRLKWTRQGSLRISFPKEDVSEYELTFDIADVYDEAVEAGNIALLDGRVTLTDAERNTAEIRISDIAAVYPTLPVRMDKLDHIFGTEDYRHSYSTVNIPVSKFNADRFFDPTSVIQISISFDGAGEVIIDNVGWNK